MKKLLIIIIWFLCYSATAQGVMPTNEQSVKEIAELDQKSTRKKIWGNMLAWYQSARGMATSSLETLDGISNMAYASYKQLAAIEQVARKATLVYDNISDIDKWKELIKDPEKLIIYTEEQVFQNSDKLFLEDVPYFVKTKDDLDKARRNLQDDVNRVGKDGVELLKETGALSKKVAEETSKLATAAYLNTVGMIAPGSSITSKINEMSNNSKVNAKFVSSVAEAAAKTQATDIQLETQAEILDKSATINQKEQLSPQKQSKENKENARNSVLLAIQEHDIVGTTINTLSYQLLQELTDIDYKIVSSQLLSDGILSFSQELKRHRDEAEKKRNDKK